MWKDEYAIGVDHIDEQHKSLFNKTGELLGLAADGVDKNRESIIEIIVFLKGYALNHFKAEEDYQKAIKYEGFDDHQAEHKAFIKTVLQHEAAMVASNFAEKDVNNFATALNLWLTFHVTNSDQKIVGKSPLNDIVM